MNARIFAIAMAAASTPTFVACASIEFVIVEPDASSDGGTDVAVYDEPLIVHFDAASTERDAGVQADGKAAADRSACDSTKSPHDDPCVIDDALGVFVAPIANGGNDATGTGTKANPYATIGHAIASAGHRGRVYVCDATYTEQVTLFWTLDIYGGLACPGSDAGAPWGYVVGGVAHMVSPSGDPALTINAVAPAISIEDMALTASDASGQDATGNGKSSVAAFVKASAVDFRRCVFRAGNGANGRDGTTGANYSVSAKTAPDGVANDGGTGGAGGVANCADGTNSMGGRGGDGSPDGGASGSNGSATPIPMLSAPRDGKGGGGAAATCRYGDPGASGTPAFASPVPAGYGSLRVDGWAPAASGDGVAAGPGQGGGGGGGQATPLVGGTGGGAGGCGGAGGSAGKGGGASIALAFIASIVTFDASSLTAANAGNGGRGGDGQAGQGGGTYGAAVGPCLGGYGGNGAGGGGAAGGTGGISVDVVYQGNAPSGTRLYSTGNPGQPGAGGTGGAGGTNAIGTGAAGPNGSPGLAGLATNIWQMQ